MKKFILTITALLSIVSCDRYLDVQPTGQVIPTTIEDYDLLLNGSSHSIHTLANEDALFYTADDIQYNDDGGDPNNVDNQPFQLYSFSNLRFANPNTAELSWNSAYANIYVYNKVISEIMAATPAVGYNKTDKQSIKAQAHFGRALDYFYLINTFAKHYSPANASSDGVPLILDANITQSVGDRNSVGEVYAQIISDLEEAIPNLPAKGSNKTRANKASGYALLSRIYLYMSDYDKALDNANKALAINGTLADYTTATTNALMTAAYNAEQYSWRLFGYTKGHARTLTDNFKATFDTDNDTRYTRFYAFHPSVGEYKKFYPDLNQLPSVGEMYITRAEIYARQGNAEAAINELNELRSKRISNYTDLTSTDFSDNNALIKFALEERRRELANNGTRLFDIKRLNIEPQFAQTTTHTINGTDYTADPNSNKLVLPIPAQVMKFNPNWKQN